jgi:CHAD domain-containing protein
MDTVTPQPAPFPLVVHADRLVDGLRELVPKALAEWDEDAIHHARVGTRRLKAVVDLLRPVVSADARKPFSRIGRKLRRRLGPLRDLDVMLGHLGELAAHRTHADAVAWLSQRLRAARDRARQNSTDQKPPSKVVVKLDAWGPLRGEIAEAHEAVDSLLVESIHLQIDAFAEQAQRLTSVPEAPESGVDVHELRIAGKALRYTLEMAREQDRPLAPAVLRTFKRMQEALGLWHDFVVLTEWAMRASLDELLAHHDTAMQAKVFALARLTLGRAERHLKRFADLWAREGTGLAETIRGSFPLTRAVSAPQTDPGPPATAEPPAPEAPPRGAAPAA